ncbi:MAG: HPr family phosphocarrier protein [Thermodesulfobacteriota bacterium]
MSVEKTLTIKNRLGLHARAASRFVQTTNKFTADVFVSKDGQEVDGKSIMGLLILAAPEGSEIEVRVSGEDAEAAIAAIEELIDRRFDEEE